MAPWSQTDGVTQQNVPPALPPMQVPVSIPTVQLFPAVHAAGLQHRSPWVVVWQVPQL